jgi:hypothetical protein
MQLQPRHCHRPTGHGYSTAAARGLLLCIQRMHLNSYLNNNVSLHFTLDLALTGKNVCQYYIPLKKVGFYNPTTWALSLSLQGAT